MKKKLNGPNGLTVELDRNELYHSDPGRGTPAMVYRNKGRRNECGGTFECVISEGEFSSVSGDGNPALDKSELAWLDAQQAEVERFLA